jgi:DNA polymerase delta subunit 3
MATDVNYLGDLQQWTFEEKKIITYRYLSTKLQVSSNVAKQMLYDFYQKNPQIEVLFVLSGKNKRTKKHTISIVPKSQLEEAKNSLDPIVSLHVYSVQLAIPKDSASIAVVDRDLWLEIDQKNIEQHVLSEGNPFVDHRFSSLYNIPQEPKQKVVSSPRHSNVIDLCTPPNESKQKLQQIPNENGDSHQTAEVDNKRQSTKTKTTSTKRTAKATTTTMSASSIASLFANSSLQKQRDNASNRSMDQRQQESSKKEIDEGAEDEIRFEETQPKPLKRLRTSVGEQTNANDEPNKKRQKTEANESNAAVKEKASQTLRKALTNSTGQPHKEGIIKELFQKQQNRTKESNQSKERLKDNDKKKETEKPKENVTIQKQKKRNQPNTKSTAHRQKKDDTNKRSEAMTHNKMPKQKTADGIRTSTKLSRRNGKNITKSKRKTRLRDSDVEENSHSENKSSNSNSSNSSSNSSDSDSEESCSDSSSRQSQRSDDTRNSQRFSSSQSSSSENESEDEKKIRKSTKEWRHTSAKKRSERAEETKEEKSKSTATIEELLKKTIPQTEKRDIHQTNAAVSSVPSTSSPSLSTTPRSKQMTKQTPVAKQKITVEETYVDERNFKRHRPVTKFVDVPVNDNSGDSQKSGSLSVSPPKSQIQLSRESDTAPKQSDIKSFFKIAKK